MCDFLFYNFFRHNSFLLKHFYVFWGGFGEYTIYQSGFDQNKEVYLMKRLEGAFDV